MCLGGGEGAGEKDGFSLEKTAFINPSPYFILYNLVYHLLWAVWYSVLESKKPWFDSWLYCLLARTPLVIFWALFSTK